MHPTEKSVYTACQGIVYRYVGLHSFNSRILCRHSTIIFSATDVSLELFCPEASCRSDPITRPRGRGNPGGD